MAEDALILLQSCQPEGKGIDPKLTYSVTMFWIGYGQNPESGNPTMNVE